MVGDFGSSSIGCVVAALRAYCGFGMCVILLIRYDVMVFFIHSASAILGRLGSQSGRRRSWLRGLWRKQTAPWHDIFFASLVCCVLSQLANEKSTADIAGDVSGYDFFLTVL